MTGSRPDFHPRSRLSPLRASLFVLVAALSAWITAVYAADPPEADLAQLDPFARRYNVPAQIEKVRQIPWHADKGFSFAVWGDVRSNPEVFSALWEAINREPVLFAVTTGDLVRRGTVQEWLADFFPIIDRHDKVVFFPVLGNHDVGARRMEYLRIFGVRDYAFDYGDCRFVVADNSGEGFSDEQLRWMEEQLASAAGRHVFVFAHKPPKTIEKWAYHSFSQNAEAFCGLMSRYKVEHVYLGHIHAYSTAELDGVAYTITGGGGAGLHTRFGKLGNVHHYLVVRVDKNGVRQEVVRLVDNQLVRSEPGNDFYRHPRELLTGAAREAVAKAAPKAEIDEVSPSERDGKTLFRVELTESLEGSRTRDLELSVTEAGGILSEERELFAEEIPDSVARRWQADVPGGKLTGAALLREEKAERFVLTGQDKSGKESKRIYAPDGTPITEN